jgi:hypothetical protein
VGLPRTRATSKQFSRQQVQHGFWRFAPEYNCSHDSQFSEHSACQPLPQFHPMHLRWAYLDTPADGGELLHRHCGRRRRSRSNRLGGGMFRRSGAVHTAYATLVWRYRSLPPPRRLAALPSGPDWTAAASNSELPPFSSGSRAASLPEKPCFEEQPLATGWLP